jgi:plastocyanin
MSRIFDIQSRMPKRHLLLPVLGASAMLSMTACGGAGTPMPGGPAPPPVVVTANAYILPDAVSRNDWAFGNKPVVVRKGERLRWVNADTLTHVIAANAPGATDFRTTAELPPGGDQSFIMTRPGTTGIHCTIHPNMTGTLIVTEQ